MPRRSPFEIHLAGIHLAQNHTSAPSFPEIKGYVYASPEFEAH